MVNANTAMDESVYHHVALTPRPAPPTPMPSVPVPSNGTDDGAPDAAVGS